MILQRLVEYYDRRRDDPTDPAPGFGLGRERIGFALVIDPGGGPPRLDDLRMTPARTGKTGKQDLIGRWMIVPYRGDRSSNIKANFLWDNTGYVFGRTKKAKVETKKRQDFISLHNKLLSLVADDGLSIVVDFLTHWNPAEYDNFTLASEALDQTVVFRIKDRLEFVHDSLALKHAWQSFFPTDLEHKSGLDLITGQPAKIATTHFLISDVGGSKTTGASLSSFNDAAYTSYRMKGGLNSPVSIENTFRYAAALKELLSYERRKILLGDATVTFWSERPTRLEAYASEIFGDVPPLADNTAVENKARIEQIRHFLSQIRDGYASGDALDPEDKIGFCVLGLSPNAARLSVRFWLDSTVGDLKGRLARHMAHTRLSTPWGTEPPVVFRQIVQSTGRAEFKDGKFKGYAADTVPKQLVGAIARAVLNGTPYPAMLMGQMLGRLRADRHFGHERLASIKAYLIRNKNKEQFVSLNTEHPSAAYHCGRLLCLLDYIQSQAIGNVNAGVVKKYYTAAAAQPFAVFGRLVALTTKAHLPKLNSPERPGFADFCERLLRQVMSKIGDRFPRVLTLDEQGEFALGFYNEKEELPDTPPRFESITARGERVKSRAEVTVADALLDLGLNYEYERPLKVLDHKLMHPDFTVIGEVPADNVFVEYLGLSDNSEYMEKWSKKAMTFRAGGILPEEEGKGPNGRLVTFSGTKTSGVDSAQIRTTLRRIFGLN